MKSKVKQEENTALLTLLCNCISLLNDLEKFGFLEKVSQVVKGCCNIQGKSDNMKLCRSVVFLLEWVVIFVA